MPAPAAPVPPAPAVSLAELTTLRLGGPALDVVEPKTQDELAATVLDLDRAGRPLLVVGGGSNLVVSDDGFAGTVVLVGIRGVTRQVEGDYVGLTAAAG